MGMFDGFFQNAGNILQNAGQTVGGVAQGVAHAAAQLPSEAADVVAAPFRDVGAYIKIQSNQQAKAQLDAINKNPKLSEDQKIALTNNLKQKYGGQTPDQEASAQQGSQLGMGMTSPATGANFISDAAPFIKPAVGQTMSAAGDAASNVAHDFTGPESQAGYIRIPGGAEPPPSAATLLDKNGQPFTHQAQPSEMGSYKYNDNTGEMTPNAKPQQPQYSTTQELPVEGQAGVKSPQLQNGQPTVSQPRTMPVEPVAAPKPLPKAQYNVVSKVVAPDAAKSVFGSEHTAAIQDALERNGVQDYSQIAQAAHNLYDSVIKPTLSNTPKLVSIDTITNAIVSQMQKMKPGLDSVAAKTAAGNVIRDMYDSARGVNGDGLVPTHIDTPSLFNIRQDLNNTDAVKSFYKGNPPQDLEDRATVAARQALSKVLQIAHPNVAQATKDYGLLSDAVPSIYKATSQAAKDAENAPSFADKYLPNSILATQMTPVYNAVHDLTTNPIGRKVLGGGALIGGGVGAKMAFDHFNNGGTDLQNAQENQGAANTPGDGVSNTHTNSITQAGTNSKGGYLQTSDLPKSQGDVRLNTDGSVHVASPSQVKDASGNIIGIDDNSFNKQVASINNDIKLQQNIIKQNPMNDRARQVAESAIAQDQSTMDSLKTLHDSSKPINDAYSLTTLITGQTAQALHTLENTSPNISDLNSQIDNLQNNLIPRYAAFKQQLQGIAATIKGGNLDVKTKGALQSVLKEINQQNAWDYYNKINSYVGDSNGPDATSTSGSGPAASNYQPTGGSSYSQPETVDFSDLRGPLLNSGQATGQ